MSYKNEPTFKENNFSVPAILENVDIVDWWKNFKFGAGPCFLKNLDLNSKNKNKKQQQNNKKTNLKITGLTDRSFYLFLLIEDFRTS